MWNYWIHCHLGRTIGLGLVFIATLIYRSENRDVFGLWSWAYVGVLLAIGSMFCISLVYSWIYRHAKTIDKASAPSLASVCLEMAFFVWGTGYFINGFESARNWGQIADLNFFGSSHPAAVMLLWLALFISWVSLAGMVVAWRRTSKIGSAIMATWVTVAVFVLVEGGLRLRAVIAPEPQGYPTYTTALWARTFASSNQLGFRDKDHSIQKSPDTHRLLIVGDSLAFGWGVKRTDDRFGEQLAERLRKQTITEWEVINASRGDTDTLTHIRFLQLMQDYQPDVILLLYAFNDIDYLVPVTPREGPSEHMVRLRDRLSPVRVLFTNFFLFQDFYVRLRILAYQTSTDGEGPVNDDPYRNDAILARHFKDLTRFVSLASQSGAVVAIVPFDIKIAANSALQKRYEHFVSTATALGLPIWAAGPEAFVNHAYSDLIVNKLDSHPNALAHRLLAQRIATPLQNALKSESQVAHNVSREGFAEAL